ncbi:hypothetical protein D9M71_580750 [compost metagenome]
MQHRTDLRTPGIQLGVQQGFRRGLLARFQAVAGQVGRQHVVDAELALVLAGHGQQRLIGSQARRVVAAGRRGPAAGIEEATGFDDLPGQLFTVVAHALSSFFRQVLIMIAAPSAARLAMAKVQAGPRLLQL